MWAAIELKLAIRRNPWNKGKRQEKSEQVLDRQILGASLQSGTYHLTRFSSRNQSAFCFFAVIREPEWNKTSPARQTC